MRISTVLAILIGLILIPIGILFISANSSGHSANSYENELYLERNHFFTVGGESAEKINAEYSSTEPVDIYLTTNSSASHAELTSIESLEDYILLEGGKSSGKIEYKTPDKNKKYYLIFNNINDLTIQLHVYIEFIDDNNQLYNLLPGLVLIFSGIILLTVGIYFQIKAVKR